MATQETQILDEIIVRSRRKMLSLGSAALAGLAISGVTKAQAQTTTLVDADYLNFALQLEYLEANFYNLAANGVTIDKLPTPIAITGTGTAGGAVITKPNFAKVPFVSTTIAAYATETAGEEGKHVTFLRNALSSAAVAQPQLDLYNSFNTLAMGALGLSSFDPFASDAFFLIGAFVFEDVGVTAYSGAAGAITTNSTLVAAAGILATEAYHAGLVRTAINAADAGTDTLNSITRKIAAFRNKLDGVATTDDIGLSQTTAPLMVSLEASAATYPSQTIVDANSTTSGTASNSLTYSRTPTQVLQIVTGSTSAPHKGVFFPNGLNGNIT
jgi:hypothetical protein